MTNVKTRGVVLCGLFTALIAVGAWIHIPVPAVPFTLQFLFTNLAGLLLGRRLGSLSVLSYVCLGLVGVPVFVSGGGFGYVLQPTFGYLVGFILGTWVAGGMAERIGKNDTKSYVKAGLVNLAVVYTCGMIYYFLICKFYLQSPIGIGALFIYCFLVFLPGDVALSFVSALLAKRLRPAIRGGC